jgi:hypothetical protein
VLYPAEWQSSLVSKQLLPPCQGAFVGQQPTPV